MPETCTENKYINILNGTVHIVGLIYETVSFSLRTLLRAVNPHSGSTFPTV